MERAAQRCNRDVGDLLLEHQAQFPDPKNVSVAVMALTGFTILCDWLDRIAISFLRRPVHPLAITKP